MSVHSKKCYCLLPVLLWFSNALAQQVVELNLSSTQSGFVIQKLTSTGSVPRQNRGPLLFCDRAVQHSSGHQLSAYGHVLLVQGDSITIKGDSLLYDNNSRQATVQGHVMFQDRRTILTTDQLVYSLALGIAKYDNRARIVDNRTVLTSQQGTYNAQLKQFIFHQNVRLVNGRTAIAADSLRYNTSSQLAIRLTPTPIPPISNPSLIVAQQSSPRNRQKEPTVQHQTSTKLPHPDAVCDTLVPKNLIASVDSKSVARQPTTIPVALVPSPGEPSTPKQAARRAVVETPLPKSVVTLAVQKSTNEMPPADSIRTQPSLYRTSFQPTVTTSSPVNKKNQGSSETSKPLARTAVIRAAVMISTSPPTDLSQESDLERELNKTRRFN